jgi:hypothetical protein
MAAKSNHGRKPARTTPTLDELHAALHKTLGNYDLTRRQAIAALTMTVLDYCDDTNEPNLAEAVRTYKEFLTEMTNLTFTMRDAMGDLNRHF